MKAPQRHYPHIFVLCFLFVLALSACGNGSTSTVSSTTTVHLGYFPNLTHAIALVGVQRGTFQQALGSNPLVTTTFNAGPDLITALEGGSIDIGFVGPNPAVNGYVTSHGAALRIIAGASSGGVEFIVRPGAHITSSADLSGKKIADPQTGGTQDISLRHYLQQHGLKPDSQGGTVHIVPTSNAAILTEFQQGQIDGAWVPEPYASQLVIKYGGKVFLDERSLWPNGQFVTTNVVVRTAFLNQHRTLVQKFLQAEVATVQYINSNLASAETLINQQLKKLTTKALPSNVLDRSFQDLTITYDPLASSLLTTANNAHALGYLGTSKPDLSGIYDLGPLNSILKSQGLSQVAIS